MVRVAGGCQSWRANARDFHLFSSRSLKPAGGGAPRFAIESLANDDRWVRQIVIAAERHSLVAVSEFGITGSAREGNNVADVRHAGDE
jgi:hypothetical protein